MFQSLPSSITAPPAGIAPTVIGPIGLLVRDLPNIIDFYRESIGLSVQQQSDHAAVLGVGGAPLIQLQHTPVEIFRRRSPGLYHTAILLPSRASLAEWLHRAISTGVTLRGAADHGVSEAIYLEDPEGNGIEIYQDRAKDLWPRTAGGLAMVTERLDVDGLLAEIPNGKATPIPAELSPQARIGHVHLRVANLSAAEAFYRDLLKMNLMQRFGDSAAFLSYGGYHHHLGLNTWESRGTLPRPAGAPGLFAFHLYPPDSSVYESIRAAAHTHAANHGGSGDDGSLQLQDPSGNRIVVHRV